MNFIIFSVFVLQPFYVLAYKKKCGLSRLQISAGIVALFENIYDEQLILTDSSNGRKRVRWVILGLSDGSAPFSYNIFLWIAVRETYRTLPELLSFTPPLFWLVNSFYLQNTWKHKFRIFAFGPFFRTRSKYGSLIWIRIQYPLTFQESGAREAQNSWKDERTGKGAKTQR